MRIWLWVEVFHYRPDSRSYPSYPGASFSGFGSKGRISAASLLDLNLRVRHREDVLRDALDVQDMCSEVN